MTVEEAADIMDKCYLEWSRAKERGDAQGMREAMDKSAAAASDCDDPTEALAKHVTHAVGLAMKRAMERMEEETPKLSRSLQ